MNPTMAIDFATTSIMNAPQFMDEVALCFHNEEALIEFVEHAKRLGLEHFNSVPYDTMKRQDKLGEEFGVRFEFLRHPEREWRIEAMAVIDGEAPLHKEALDKYGAPCIVHLSYKCEDLDAYQMEVRRMFNDRGATKVAEYSNSYGMFSYWRPHGQQSMLPYWKPRVNLRDVMAQSS